MGSTMRGVRIHEHGDLDDDMTSHVEPGHLEVEPDERLRGC